MPGANHSEAGRGILKWAKYPRQDQNNIPVSTTPFHPRQNQKGGSMLKIPELSFKA